MLAHSTQDFPLVVIADPDLLEQRAIELGSPIKINLLQNLEKCLIEQPGLLNVMPVKLNDAAVCGELNANNSQYVLQTLKLAVNLCQSGQCGALVTGPVHKGIINDANIHFTGHTEFLADLTQSYPVMMLATKVLRVALATTHLPLLKVAEAITQEKLIMVVNILHHDLRCLFNIEQPKIYVSGLNPHAGENGHLGKEELEIITPALDILREKGIDVIGPLSADTIFVPEILDDADVILTMYHDQGLPVLKYSGFGEAVNITLGLPIIRTSVDHGTALPLAGTGKIKINSLLLALKSANEMMMHRQNTEMI
jgi:4-hydroxythreonine-4-phosphate dehydrogenase